MNGFIHYCSNFTLLPVNCLTLNVSLLQLPAIRLSCKYAKFYPCFFISPKDELVYLSLLEWGS